MLAKALGIKEGDLVYAYVRITIVECVDGTNRELFDFTTLAWVRAVIGFMEGNILVKWCFVEWTVGPLI